MRSFVQETSSSPGDLPDERPVVQNAGSGFGSFKRGSPCLICGEPDAVGAYFWIGGRVAHFHATLQRALKPGTRIAAKRPRRLRPSGERCTCSSGLDSRARILGSGGSIDGTRELEPLIAESSEWTLRGDDHVTCDLFIHVIVD